MLVGGRTVPLTNPDRVLLDDLTKRAALDYFLAVGDGILRALHDRPTMLERRRDDEVFFQRRLPRGAPDWVSTTWLEHYEVVCPRTLADVAWLVNLGAVTFHPWPVRAGSVHGPDRLLIDLDPQPGTGFPEAVAVARELRSLLDQEAYPKTSGGRGLHLIVPIEPRPWTEVQKLRETLARQVVERLPDVATTARLKRDRGARVFVDCGPQTVASAYSIRPGRLVSAPLTWDELDTVRPEDFDVDTMPARFDAVGDLGAP